MRGSRNTPCDGQDKKALIVFRLYPMCTYLIKRSNLFPIFSSGLTAVSSLRRRGRSADRQDRRDLHRRHRPPRVGRSRLRVLQSVG